MMAGEFAPKRRCLAAVGSLAVAFVASYGLSLYSALPAWAMNGSLEFCPYLPYLAKGSSQMVQGDYSWALLSVDPGGRSVVVQSGRDRGCHAVSPVANAAYKVVVQTECTRGGAGNFRLTGMSPVIWVPEDSTSQVHARVDSGWTTC